MKSKIFQECIKFTKSDKSPITENNKNLINSVTGIIEEASELLSDIKESSLLNKELDKTHILDQLGDQLYWIGDILNQLGFSFEDAFDANQKKLSERYPSGFNIDDYIDRYRIKRK